MNKYRVKRVRLVEEEITVEASSREEADFLAWTPSCEQGDSERVEVIQAVQWVRPLPRFGG